MSAIFLFLNRNSIKYKRVREQSFKGRHALNCNQVFNTGEKTHCKYNNKDSEPKIMVIMAHIFIIDVIGE